jgi:hypothetical protein
VSLSTHYYVLSLTAGTSLLFEAFRDFLIELENRGFPVAGPREGARPRSDGELRKLTRTVDSCFGRHYAVDPLKVVVVGEKNMIAAFGSVTTHGHAVVGYMEGDYTCTTSRDLGQIVWPVVREAMSGVVDTAMRDFQAQAARGMIASGLDSVARQVAKGVRTTLLVEEDYHMKGSLAGTGESLVISSEVDVRDEIDDAIDAVIEKALKAGGNVIFTPSGSLREQQRIVSFLRNGRETDHPGGHH